MSSNRQHPNLLETILNHFKETWRYYHDLPEEWRKAIAFIMKTCAGVVLGTLSPGICLRVILFIAVGLLLMPNRHMKKLVPIIVGVLILLLSYELFVGVSVSGNCLWPTSIQPDILPL